MTGFIDPSAPERIRLDRIEALLAEALPLLGVEALSPEAQVIFRDLQSKDAVRRERGRRAVQQAMAADPLDTPEGEQ